MEGGVHEDGLRNLYSYAHYALIQPRILGKHVLFALSDMSRCL